ncbi:hypothetical protein E4K72_20995 [Oxalobacteraceae bacterium OM1]|nr:hypothetical protein E4K72_20995 [Oxalobacteraceae bacterium OM1]
MTTASAPMSIAVRNQRSIAMVPMPAGVAANSRWQRYARNKPVVGLEYCNDCRRDQSNYDLPSEPQFDIVKASPIAAQRYFDQCSGTRGMG